MKLKHTIAIGVSFALVLGSFPVLADLGYNPGSVTTIFDFLCFTSKHCSAHVNINSSGTEIMTSANPAKVGASSGAMVDGWDATQGTQADAAYAGSGSATTISGLKGIYGAVTGSIPAGTASIGAVGSDPSLGVATPTMAFLALPATATTQIIALSGTTKTYITSRVVLAGGTVNVTFKYGTGSNCGSGTTTLDGPWPLTAQTGFSEGSGTGAVMIVPAGQALCITTDASVSGGVKLTYQQK